MSDAEVKDMPQKQAAARSPIFMMVLAGVLLGIIVSVIMNILPASPPAEVSQAVAPPAPYQQALEKLKARFGLQPGQLAIVVILSEQKLLLLKNDAVVASYPISGAAAGAGSRVGSNQTPLGAHKVLEKIGDGVPVGGVFRSRAYKGEMAKIYTDQTDVADDLVTTRIMWLRGLEPGLNSGAGVDSHSRFIYIHGTPEEGLIGTPASHGCIRMKNLDVVQLFDAVPSGTLVEIIE